MLVGGEVGHDIEAFLLAENALEDWIGKVQGVAAELVRDVKAVGAADVANQLGEAVFVEVHHDYAFGLEAQHGLDEAGANAASATDDADLLAFDFLGEFLLVCLNVWGEQTDGAEGYAVGDEFGEVEHIWGLFYCRLLCERASEGASALSAQKNQIIQLLLLDLQSKKGGGATRGRGIINIGG